MNCLLPLVILACVVVAAYADCGGYPAGHTLCLPAADCSKSNGGPCGPASAAEIAEILSEHNKYRTLVAEGKEKRGSPGPQPAGTDIYELKWNPELAKVAQRWAEQMVARHDCDDCHVTKQYSSVGQNIGLKGDSTAMTKAEWAPRIEDWDSEVIYLNGLGLQKEINFQVVGHYTQVIWGKTKEVGCGAYGNNKDCGSVISTWAGLKCVIYVCNYGPGGNEDGDEPYSTTSKCAKYSAKYPKLCVD